MRTTRLSALLVTTLAFEVNAAGDETVPFREAWGWAVVVPVAAGGSEVHEMLLDTGTTSTILEPSLAAELGVTPTARARLLTPAGARMVEVASVELALGGTRLGGVEVVIAEMPAVRSDEPGIRGILGQSALAALEYTIDHARRRVVIHGRRPHTSQGASAPQRPTLDVHLGCGSEAVRLVVDSGVAAPVLFDGGSRSPGIELGGVVHAATNTGDAVWREGRLAALCVAGRRTGPISVVVRPRGEVARTEDGLLPSRLFARVRVGPEGRVLSVQHW
jgi:predicted aspartyl protease